MRYKENVLNKLNQADILINRVTTEVNRNVNQDTILESLTKLKEQVEVIRETIAIEPDDFEQQFAPKF
jgi:division protein CdvB (Snf7/Vps24/ESCRT-III family)